MLGGVVVVVVVVVELSLVGLGKDIKDQRSDTTTDQRDWGKSDTRLAGEKKEVEGEGRLENGRRSEESRTDGDRLEGRQKVFMSFRVWSVKYKTTGGLPPSPPSPQADHVLETRSWRHVARQFAGWSKRSQRPCMGWGQGNQDGPWVPWEALSVGCREYARIEPLGETWMTVSTGIE